MKIEIEYFDGIFNIDAPEFKYSAIENMYVTGNGESLQPGCKMSKREEDFILMHCHKIHNTVKELEQDLKEFRK